MTVVPEVFVHYRQETNQNSSMMGGGKSKLKVFNCRKKTKEILEKYGKYNILKNEFWAFVIREGLWFYCGIDKNDAGEKGLRHRAGERSGGMTGDLLKCSALATRTIANVSQALAEKLLYCFRCPFFICPAVRTAENDLFRGLCKDIAVPDGRDAFPEISAELFQGICLLFLSVV